jgi:hypothetical protein
MQEVGPEQHTFEFDDEQPGTVHHVDVQAKVPGLHQTCEPSDSVFITFTTPLEGIQITATSPIPLYFSAGGDPPKLIPHTVSTGIRGEASELAIGMTEGDVVAHYHVDGLEEVIVEDVHLGYQVIATWNLGLGTVHFDVTPTTNILLAPEVTRVEMLSGDEVKFTFRDIPSVPDLKIQCFQPLYRMRADGEWGAMCVAGIYLCDINPYDDTAILPCCSGKSFEHDQTYETELRFLAPYYESSPEVPITFSTPLEPSLSRPTYEIQHISTDYAWVQMTCCIKECGETCGTHIPAPSDEYDECSYEVETSEDGVNWREVGLDIEGLTPSTLYHVRVRTVDLPDNRCLASDWVTKTFTTLPIEPLVTLDIAASIEAGGIPEAIKTGRDETLTFILKNLGTNDVWVDIFLTFENHDLPRIYPHNLTGLIPLGLDSYTLPDSNIYIWNDAYVATNPILVGAGESGPYTITVFLPHDAIPTGEESVRYVIRTKVGVY